MKSTSHFHFKQFSVRHDTSVMKVGTDAVLIGSWADVGDAQSILDIGTGSGVIALMMAQRSSNTSRIDAVEIDRMEANCASENVLNSPWPKKISVHTTRIQDFSPGYNYNLIVSNPPYFIDSQKSPEENRSVARHTVTLDHKDLSNSVRRLLNANGRFCIILPAPESSIFITAARFDGLFCSRKVSFKSRSNKSVERIMMEFKLSPEECIISEIVLYDGKAAWSDDYYSLTKDFYLERLRKSGFKENREK